MPLFVEELTRSVIESGMLREHSASWEIVEPGAELIPMAVHAPLIARIDRLGSARSTAQLAATIGREFSFGLLSAVSDRDEATFARTCGDSRKPDWPGRSASWTRTPSSSSTR